MRAPMVGRGVEGCAVLLRIEVLFLRLSAGKAIPSGRLWSLTARYPMSAALPRQPGSSRPAIVKSFGGREAYESLRRRNPRGPRLSAMGIGRFGPMAASGTAGGKALDPALRQAV